MILIDFYNSLIYNEDEFERMVCWQRVKLCPVLNTKQKTIDISDQIIAMLK